MICRQRTISSAETLHTATCTPRELVAETSKKRLLIISATLCQQNLGEMYQSTWPSSTVAFDALPERLDNTKVCEEREHAWIEKPVYKRDAEKTTFDEVCTSDMV